MCPGRCLASCFAPWLEDVALAAPRSGGSVVVAADLVAVGLVAVPRLVELGRALDLVLRPLDEDRLRVEVDPLDDVGRQHDLLAEDPRAGVDDDVATRRVVRRLVDLPDAAVDRLDAEAGEIEPAAHVGTERAWVPVRPGIGCRGALHGVSLPLLSRRGGRARRAGG